MRFNIISYSTIGSGMSGGDRIWIEFARKWSQAGYDVKVYVYEDGYKICQRNQLTDVSYDVLSVNPFLKKSFSLLYLARTFLAISKWRKIARVLEVGDIVYSASDFWPDTLPAYFAKKNSKAFWIAGFYLFMPFPLNKKFPYRGLQRLTKGIFYWLSQRLSYKLVNNNADSVFVTSDPDVQKFSFKKRNKNAHVVIRGGVDINIAQKVPDPQNKKYQAVFIGRFHPQKGVLQLVDIWRYVVDKHPNYKLAIIGEGSLKENLERKIKLKDLEKNIELYGFTDGEKKIRIFKNSRIVLHPAVYDSGGMAACEAMACGLPCVGFDLEAFETYYPKGMVKVPLGDNKAFAGAIISLLKDERMYNTYRQQALDWAAEWAWEKRAGTVLEKIEALVPG